MQNAIGEHAYIPVCTLCTCLHVNLTYKKKVYYVNRILYTTSIYYIYIYIYIYILYIYIYIYIIWFECSAHCTHSRTLCRN